MQINSAWLPTLARYGSPRSLDHRASTPMSGLDIGKQFSTHGVWMERHWRVQRKSPDKAAAYARKVAANLRNEEVAIDCDAAVLIWRLPQPCCNNLHRASGRIAVDPVLASYGKFRICRKLPEAHREVLDDADYAVMQAPSDSIRQSEPPITPPVSTAAPPASIPTFLVCISSSARACRPAMVQNHRLAHQAARQAAVAIELIGETTISADKITPTGKIQLVHFAGAG